VEVSLLKVAAPNWPFCETECEMEAYGVAVELKKCPRCDESLPLSDFGVCRARKDGLNLYCKQCIRKRIAQSRQTMREYKTARNRGGVNLLGRRAAGEKEAPPEFSPLYVARMLKKLTPAERVREAIRGGARTQKQIAQETKLAKDEIGDALANLLLWTHEIRTRMVNNTRMYFINEVEGERPALREVRNPQPMLPFGPEPEPSFSSLRVLMPGNPVPERVAKVGVWIAA
jgi:hypothetical protein